MNIAEFFAMGGYATYVWSSFGITLVVLVANVIATRQQRRRVEKEIAAIVTERKGS